MGLFKKMFGSLSTKPDTGEDAIPTSTSGDIPEEAQDIVDQLKQQFPGADVQVQSVSMSGDPDAAKQVISAVEQATGQDVDGDGTVQGKDATVAAKSGDHVGELERLAKLHEQGALTDAEFATEKAKIVGS